MENFEPGSRTFGHFLMATSAKISVDTHYHLIHLEGQQSWSPLSCNCLAWGTVSKDQQRSITHNSVVSRFTHYSQTPAWNFSLASRYLNRYFMTVSRFNYYLLRRIGANAKSSRYQKYNCHLHVGDCRFPHVCAMAETVQLPFAFLSATRTSQVSMRKSISETFYSRIHVISVFSLVGWMLRADPTTSRLHDPLSKDFKLQFWQRF